ncbi:hypothetical protein KAR48_19110 [bacterium]|nr:hypothetical protein [bacterium]
MADILGDLAPLHLACSSVLFESESNADVISMNPALLSGSTSLSLNAWICMPWGLKKLSIVGAGVSKSWQTGRFAMLFHAANHPLYSEKVVWTGASISLGALGNLGFAVALATQNVTHHSLKKTGICNIGYTIEIPHFMQLHICMQRLLAQNSSNQHQCAFSFGSSMKIASSFSIACIARKSQFHPLTFSLALYQDLQSAIRLYCGFSHETDSIHFGVMISNKKIQYQTAAAWHNTLGMIQSTGIKWIH